MLDFDFSQITFLFISYSLIGWICESVVASGIAKRFINRGLLFGPCNFAYGIGSLLLLILTDYLKDYPVVIFFVAALLAMIIEIVMIFLFEKIFYAKWWRSDKKKNLSMIRSAVINLIGFGTLGVLIVYVINPQLISLINWFYPDSLRVLTSMILGIIILDLILSIAFLADIRSRLQQLKEMGPLLEKLDEKYHYFKNGDSILDDLEEYHRENPNNSEVSIALYDLRKVFNMKNGESRLLNAFPKMIPLEYFDEYHYLKKRTDALADGVKTYIDDHDISDPLKEKSSKRPFTEAIIESYKSVTLTKLVWVFLVGCVAGYIIETLYCFFHNGYVESRQGMIYGPFSQVYGLGAVVLVLLLVPIAQKNTFLLFLFSALVGGLFEAGISYVQELFFGTTSWDYSDHMLSMFGGRTSGEYMLFWGLLGIFCMRLVYPKIVDLIEKIPIGSRRIFTIFIALILIIDLSVSGIAVMRWSQRQQDIPAKNQFERFVDDHYNDQFMREIYPHMKIS